MKYFVILFLFSFLTLTQFCNGQTLKFWGMTSQGGAKDSGVLFSLDPVDTIYTDQYDFNFTSGYIPVADPFEGSDGLLYGTTIYGGINYGGTLFSFDPKAK